MTCQDSFHEVAFNISFWTRNISSARILFWRGVCFNTFLYAVLNRFLILTNSWFFTDFFFTANLGYLHIISVFKFLLEKYIHIYLFPCKYINMHFSTILKNVFVKICIHRNEILKLSPEKRSAKCYFVQI